MCCVIATNTYDDITELVDPSLRCSDVLDVPTWTPKMFWIVAIGRISRIVVQKQSRYPAQGVKLTYHVPVWMNIGSGDRHRTRGLKEEYIVQATVGRKPRMNNNDN